MKRIVDAFLQHHDDEQFHQEVMLVMLDMHERQLQHLLDEVF